MNTSHLILSVVFSSLLVACNPSKPVNPQEVLLPKPKQLTLQEGVFEFSSSTKYYLDEEHSRSVVSDFFQNLNQISTLTTSETTDSTKADILFYTDPSLESEAYELDVSADRVSIYSSTEQGAYYALQTMKQLLPPSLDGETSDAKGNWSLPALSIDDAPRFPYRGLMLDVSRYFIPKETVLKIIKAAGQLKINKLHFHLVDDQGWRIEIKKYPRLTEVGAWCVERDVPFPLRKAPLQPGEATPVGGFYTQDDIREIVAFAKQHQIEVIPEIEMPAHTLSSLAAYPDLACPVVDGYIPVMPGMGGPTSKAVYCAGNDEVFHFLEDVLDEVMMLFPSSHIHLGGDEANKTYWSQCPRCKARMQKEQIQDVEDLQGYFMARMSDYLREHGRTPIGWDEWTNSTIPEGAVIFGWQGLGNAGYKAATLGHQFVMTPSRVLYLDYYQGPQWFEPRGYFGNNTLKKMYDYEPVQSNWDPAAANRLIGVQASMWCEFMESPEMVEYMVFPRIAALAEIAWIEKETKDWSDFISRLDQVTQRWDEMEINYARSMFNIDHQVKPLHGALHVTLSCERPDVEIRYTTDGSSPDEDSNLFNDSLIFSRSSQLKAATFVDGEKIGKDLNLDLSFNMATAKPVISGNSRAFLITNGIEGTDKHTDFEWCGWYDQDFSFTIDLEKEAQFEQVVLGHVVNYGMGVHFPESITLSVSDDNVSFRPIQTRKFSDDEIFQDGIFRHHLQFDQLEGSGRYLKFEISSPGETPSFHHRAGQGVWILFDEVKVY